MLSSLPIPCQTSVSTWPLLEELQSLDNAPLADLIKRIRVVVNEAITVAAAYRKQLMIDALERPEHKEETAKTGYTYALATLWVCSQALEAAGQIEAKGGPFYERYNVVALSALAYIAATRLCADALWALDEIEFSPEHDAHLDQRLKEVMKAMHGLKAGASGFEKSLLYGLAVWINQTHRLLEPYFIFTPENETAKPEFSLASFLPIAYFNPQ